MSAASVPPSGRPFGTGRGRGYRPEQVDSAVARLAREGRAAREEEARLVALAAELEEDVARLRARVAGLAPQTYETLGGRAGALFALSVEEADAVRASAREAAAERGRAAEEAGRAVKDAARAHSEAVLADAEEWVERRLLAARTEADELRGAARAEADALREEAADGLASTRRRCAARLADLDREQAGAREADERERALREGELDARLAGLTRAAEAALAEARRGFAEAEEGARSAEEAAQARAAGLLAQARAAEERVVADTDRVVRDDDAARERLRAHMDHIRTALSTLTGHQRP
ncbi:cellulose-binding protein [Streptomyces sp. Edi4]|uniref:cellulose-binding protein n=1 Tax=Streptomyces sp. Edi4 TaxID=3162527 RepID=UPI0033061F6F